VLGSIVTVLGLTFKEDCPDLRNSKVADIIEELRDYGIEVQVCDPLADPGEAQSEYGVTLVARSATKPAVAVIAAVAHAEYRVLKGRDLAALMGRNPVLVDVKGLYDRQDITAAGIRMWTL
jgi:UDP-N-acetyl-D-glucosamine/UDP-N-acetyl-D-galactosamine dehydrogenase